MRIPQLFSIGIAAVCSGACLLSAVDPARGDEATAKAKLAAKGIRATHIGLSLQTETEFSKAVTLAYSLKRKLQSATSRQHAAGSDNEEAEATVQQLMAQNEALRKQAPPPTNQPFIPFRNQINQQYKTEISQEIQANDNEIALIHEAQKQSTKNSGELRQEADSARSTYFQQVRDARALADRVVAQYAEVNKDPEVVAAIKEWNEATNTSATLKPTHGFESAVKRLEALEKKIVSEKIPLRQEGKDFYATVELNGKQKCDMIVDTKAATMMLPYQMAVDAGVPVDAEATTKRSRKDAGSKSEPKRVLLSSVRVGSITLKNVSCGVYPANARTAKAVLGLSFLGQFKYELNAVASELSLVRVDGEATVAHKTKKSTRKHIVKRSPAQIPSDEPQE
jgi:aspartyl protease family protein